MKSERYFVLPMAFLVMFREFVSREAAEAVQKRTGRQSPGVGIALLRFEGGFQSKPAQPVKKTRVAKRRR